MEGASDVGMNLSPSTTTPGDPSAASPSVWPAPSAVAWATDGMGHANALGNAAVVPGYDPSIMTAATSTCIGGVTTGCVTPATVGATSAVGSPVLPTIGSVITAVTGCSMMSEGDP